MLAFYRRWRNTIQTVGPLILVVSILAAQVSHVRALQVAGWVLMGALLVFAFASMLRLSIRMDRRKREDQ